MQFNESLLQTFRESLLMMSFTDDIPHLISPQFKILSLDCSFICSWRFGLSRRLSKSGGDKGIKVYVIKKNIVKVLAHRSTSKNRFKNTMTLHRSV